MTGRIKAARVERGWSQARFVSELSRMAARQGKQLPDPATVKSRVSRWENGHSKPDDVLPTTTARGVRDGRPRARVREAVAGAAYVGRGPAAAADTRASKWTAILIAALQAQTEAIRVQDRQFGAGALLEQLRGHVRNLEAHLGNAVFDEVRRPLALSLADAASLAGWQALDLGSIDQSWRYLGLAAAAAHQAGRSRSTRLHAAPAGERACGPRSSGCGRTGRDDLACSSGSWARS